MELKVNRVERVDGVKEAIFLPAIFNGLRLTVKHFWRNLFGARDVAVSYTHLTLPTIYSV